MTEAVLGADVLRSYEARRTAAREELCPELENQCEPGAWNPEQFAQQQIRGLVRQVFFANGSRPVRQLVFSALEPETDVRILCLRVGEALSLETAGSVAVVGRFPRAIHGSAPLECGTKQSTPLRQIATRVRGNFWLVPDQTRASDPVRATSVHSFLGEVRSQFDYSIVERPVAGESHQAAFMAQFADGIILVLSALRTRRAAARKVKETLESVQAHLLGTVLSDRIFPVPEVIYRRL